MRISTEARSCVPKIMSLFDPEERCQTTISDDIGSLDHYGLKTCHVSRERSLRKFTFGEVLAHGGTWRTSPVEVCNVCTCTGFGAAQEKN